jgi:predicted AlkP superfamily pyrophosphatase or phosphodiesterase
MTARPLVVLCCVGLTPAHLGADTPHLTALAKDGFSAPLGGVVPAVTTTAQTTMLTGVAPREHGIVGNGWYFRELGEVWLWRQSQGLVQAPSAWARARVRRPGVKVLKHFWWYAMNSDADALVTPRPAYHQDGAKSPDFYSNSADLKRMLRAAHGDFPLFSFWGPATSIAATLWIAESFRTAWDDQKPDLGLCYLPHLDYDLQRFGPTGPHLAVNLRALDAEAGKVIAHARARGAGILVVSEYGITAVERGVFINRHLRQAGLLAVTANATGELLDPGASAAFAVCDHQLAHVYCRDARAQAAAREALSGLAGIGQVLDRAGQAGIGLDHARSGELVAIADARSWFAYDYWLHDDGRPDFAQCVEIHKKPGYDPRELVFDARGGKLRAGLALLRKKLGMRYVMNAITLDPAAIRGSHGRAPAKPEDGAVVIGSEKGWDRERWAMADVAGVIERELAP